MRFLPIQALLVVVASVGCGSDEPEPGPFTTELACPKPDSLPFVPSERGWRVDANEQEVERQPRIKHQPADLLTSPTVGAAYTDVDGDAPLVSGNHLVRGVMARIENDRGIVGDVVADEFVSAWQYDEEAGWLELGMQVSGEFSSSIPGGFSIETDMATTGVERVVRYSVLNAEGSCGIHEVYELAAGRQVVVSDIDATLTLTDQEILNQIPDPNYDPLLMTASVEMTTAWANKGYQLIYMTARPHVFRSETRIWLASHGYPPGPIITASDFVANEAARAYKGQWVTRIKNDLGWDVVAAYGNAESDIDAYEDAAVDKSVTFTIGPEAGSKGTVAIENEDYTAHIADYITQQPDAN